MVGTGAAALFPKSPKPAARFNREQLVYDLRFWRHEVFARHPRYAGLDRLEPETEAAFLDAIAACRNGTSRQEAFRQGEVGAREHGQADDVHVLLDRLGDQFVRRPLETRVDDLDPRVAERVRHDLGPAVVTVEPRLRNEHLQRTLRHPPASAGVNAGR